MFIPIILFIRYLNALFSQQKFHYVYFPSQFLSKSHGFIFAHLHSDSFSCTLYIYLYQLAFYEWLKKSKFYNNFSGFGLFWGHLWVILWVDDITNWSKYFKFSKIHIAIGFPVA